MTLVMAVETAKSNVEQTALASAAADLRILETHRQWSDRTRKTVDKYLIKRFASCEEIAEIRCRISVAMRPAT